MKTILYISRSNLPPDSTVEVARLTERARLRNRTLGITGGLVFTGSHFAQLLEGPGLGPLMTTIMGDPRHRDVKLLRNRAIDQRRLGGWDMAYGGVSSYVDRHIRPLFAPLPPREISEGAERLVELIVALDRGESLAG